MWKSKTKKINKIGRKVKITITKKNKISKYNSKKLKGGGEMALVKTSNSNSRNRNS